jgi:hypothetical protein
MQHRSSLLLQDDGRWGLKPDFFTSAIQIDAKTNQLSLYSLSTMLQPPEADAFHRSGQLVCGTNNVGSPFSWEDVRTLGQLNSGSSSNLGRTKVWGNLWHRKFVNAFLIYEHKTRMFRIDRSYMLVSSPVDILSDGGTTLVKFMLATLVLPDKDLGLGCDDLQVIEIGGRPHAVVTLKTPQAAPTDWKLGLREHRYTVTSYHPDSFVD